MKFSVLASGSRGNSTIIETENTKILVDIGLSFRQLNSRLEGLGLSSNPLDGVLITHEHTDHVSGLNMLLKKVDTTCYLTKDTYEGMFYKVKENIEVRRLAFIEPYKRFQIGDFSIYPLSVSHDSNDCLGYVISSGEKKIVYVTDIGYLPEKDFDELRNADAYVFESNYDVTLLFTSNRPYYLKTRIDSIKGHMSNNDSAYNLANLIGERTKQIILAHPSKECNEENKIIETFETVFDDYGYRIEDYNLIVAKQDVPTKLIKL